MTITKAAMALPPKYWLAGTASAIFFLACYVTNAVEAPSAPAQMTAEAMEEEHVWSHGIIKHIYNWLDCPELHNNDSALEVHNETVWKLLKDTYRDVVHEDLHSLPPPSSQSDAIKGYQVPIEIKRRPMSKYEQEEEGHDSESSSSPKHTLGVFTKSDIPKDTLIWKSHNTAQFTSGADFRSYLKALPEYLACDVLDWAFPRYTADEEPVVCVDLDHGSLTNSCDLEEECNMAIQEEYLKEDTGCELAFYATRDIAAGEELKIDHDFNEAEEALVPLGLQEPLEGHLDEYDDEEHHDEDEDEEEGEGEDEEEDDEDYDEQEF